MIKKPEPIPSLSNDDHEAMSKGSKVHPHLKFISGPQQKQPKNTKTAKQAIYDNTGVGVDIRRSKTAQIESSVKPVPDVFLKPAGVDDPLDSKPVILGSKSSTHSAEADIISGTLNKKVKRERSNMDQPDRGSQKRRKKKSTSWYYDPVSRLSCSCSLEQNIYGSFSPKLRILGNDPLTPLLIWTSLSDRWPLGPNTADRVSGQDLGVIDPTCPHVWSVSFLKHVSMYVCWGLYYTRYGRDDHYLSDVSLSFESML